MHGLYRSRYSIAHRSRQRRAALLQDADVAVALGGDVLDMGQQKGATSATAHVAVVSARARAARSAPGVGCEARAAA